MKPIFLQALGEHTLDCTLKTIPLALLLKFLKINIKTGGETFLLKKLIAVLSIWWRQQRQKSAMFFASLLVPEQSLHAEICIAQWSRPAALQQPSGLPLARKFPCRRNLDTYKENCKEIKLTRKWQGYFDVQEEIRRKLHYF